MKTIYFFLCFILISIISVNAQTVLKTEQIHLKNESKENLSQIVKEYDLLMLNPKQISDECSGGNCKIVLETPNQSFLLTLEENQLFSANYTLAFNGKPEITDQKIRTFKGFIGENKDNFVRLTISNDFFGGYLNIAEEVIQIRPLNHLLPNNEIRNAFILFKNSDVIYKSSLLDCDYSEIDTLEIEAIEGVNKSSSTGCKIIEIITEADYEFYQIRGYSTTAANSSIVSVLNQAEGVFNSYFNIQLLITHQNVWTSANDPYSTSESDKLITELENNWDSNTLGRDVVYMFTGKNNMNARGRAKAFGDICNSSNFRGTYAFTASGMTNINEGITTTHEIGHLFNARHIGNTCTTLMCTLTPPDGNDYRTYTFSSSVVSIINGWISTNGSCLTDLESVSVTGADLICTTSSYSVQGLPSGSTVSTWTSDNSYLSMSYSTANRVGNYSGEATITAFGTLGGVSGCSYSADKKVWVGEPIYSKLDLVTTNSGGSHEIIACDYTSADAQYDGGSGHAIDIDEYDWDIPYASDWDIDEEYGGGGIDMRYVEIDYWEDPPPSTEVIKLRARNTCGWSSWKSITVDVEDNCGGWYLMFTPNPANGETILSIEISATKETANKSAATETVFDKNVEWNIEVYDNFKKSRLIMNKQKGKSMQMETANWENGVYVVRVLYKDRILTGKLLVEK
jgi:hypothetical protein